MHSGSCLCGKVKFTIDGALSAPVACHCTQCRKQSGHYFASANIAKAALKVAGEDFVAWYRSSEKVRRGFCRNCGSFLFWDPPAHEWISVAMGALDGPTQLQLERHIFVADKGDYYRIADGLPQNEH